jgi:hypothetical protein
MIIDIHTHLGDILHPNGGQLIFKKGIRKKADYRSGDRFGMGASPKRGRTPGFSVQTHHRAGHMGERARNATATIENMRHSMKEAGVKMTACMPIPPYVTFEDLEKACQSDDRIIPFTAVDFDRKYDFESELKGSCGTRRQGPQTSSHYPKGAFDQQTHP